MNTKGRDRQALVVRKTLSLKITGLCAFAAGGGVTKVVLPNARDMSMGTNPEIHSAVLFTPLVNFNSGRRFDFKLSRNDSAYGMPGTELAAWFLEGEELSAGLSGPVTFTPPALSAPCPSFEAPRDADSFQWVTQMIAGSDKIDSSYFDGPMPLPEVIARMVLAGGTLRTDAFAANYDKTKVLKWIFEDDGGAQVGTPRAIAEVIEFRAALPVAQGTITFASTRGAARNIVLNSPPGDLLVWLANLPLVDLLIDRGEIRKSDLRDKEFHFQHFYALAKTSDTHLPRPYKERTDPDPCKLPSSGVSNPKCPPTFFSGVK
jgi:hypothetical protein